MNSLNQRMAGVAVTVDKKNFPDAKSVFMKIMHDAIGKNIDDGLCAKVKEQSVSIRNILLKIQSILGSYGVNVSVYELEGCLTFEDIFIMIDPQIPRMLKSFGSAVHKKFAFWDNELVIQKKRCERCGGNIEQDKRYMADIERNKRETKARISQFVKELGELIR